MQVILILFLSLSIFSSSLCSPTGGRVLDLDLNLAPAVEDNEEHHRPVAYQEPAQHHTQYNNDGHLKQQPLSDYRHPSEVASTQPYYSSPVEDEASVNYYQSLPPHYWGASGSTSQPFFPTGYHVSANNNTPFFPYGRQAGQQEPTMSAGASNQVPYRKQIAQHAANDESPSESSETEEIRSSFVNAGEGSQGIEPDLNPYCVPKPVRDFYKKRKIEVENGTAEPIENIWSTKDVEKMQRGTLAILEDRTGKMTVKQRGALKNLLLKMFRPYNDTSVVPDTVKEVYYAYAVEKPIPNPRPRGPRLSTAERSRRLRIRKEFHNLRPRDMLPDHLRIYPRQKGREGRTWQRQSNEQP